MVARASSRIGTEFHSSSSLKMLHKLSRRAAGAVSFLLCQPPLWFLRQSWDKLRLELCSVLGFLTVVRGGGKPRLWTLVRFWVFTPYLAIVTPALYLRMALGQLWLSHSCVPPALNLFGLALGHRKLFSSDSWNPDFPLVLGYRIWSGSASLGKCLLLYLFM